MSQINVPQQVTYTLPMDLFNEMTEFINISGQDTVGISEYLSMHGLPEPVIASLDQAGFLSRLETINFESIEVDINSVSIIFNKMVEESTIKIEILFKGVEEEFINYLNAGGASEIEEFMQLFLKINQEIGKTATTLIYASFEKRKAELKQVAEQIKEEGKKNFSAEINRGIFTASAGFTSLAGGVYSARNQIKSSTTTSQAENIDAEVGSFKQQISQKTRGIRRLESIAGSEQDRKNLESEIQGLQHEILNNTNRAATLRARASVAGADSSRAMVRGRFGESILTTSGTFAGGDFTRQATEYRASQNEHQAQATEAEEYSNIAKSFSQQNQETARALLQFQQTVIQARSQADRSVLHVG